ncbi:transferase family protein [Arabidopsis lyrata subsp. lyrata]|uniref:Transferase family protein n=1 Tax=Arabidopsis lyrata subsp. lyrata TaxID=81972 RepID=D7MUV7_ARALL|nr:BAHD acyltransferase At5g47980 [Arabidopsis lyrata subsp. lyrata]EFH40094.1 transferase family protein [Arabidopsis lyrata subsp. lyrata]|eukprot:XP_020870152.1 BAHD acyltransferase At5g47980 [Arabidopsis lyrata subsp. lyrata]
MDTMKVEIIGKEIIKPSAITPTDLPPLQFSIMDIIMPPVYTVAFLFYTKDDLISQEQTSHTLKTSLSEILTKFHPLAGRVNGVTIESNDEGAVFVEARVDNCNLSSFLRSPDTEFLKQLLPVDDEPAPTWPLLLVQATYFQCGGMAIGLCISHKLADATSLSIFLQAWAATARGESDSVASPDFVSTKLYPAANEAIGIPKKDQVGKRTSVTKRFVFVESKIEELRNKVASDVVPRPTRVQSVTSLIWKCVVTASTDTIREKALFQPANLRPKIPSLLSENQIGNLFFATLTLDGKAGVDIVETVKELQKRAEELSGLVQHEEGSSMTIGSRLFGEIINSKFNHEVHDMHSVTSWCKIPLYKACFGWGSPVWVAGSVSPNLDDVTVLIDSKDGQGIEAWVTLHQENMLLFEQSTELLAFASPNPSVLI